MMKPQSIKMFKDSQVLIVAFLSAVLFIPFLGGVHLFDWDEINFAEASREMLMTGNYLQVQIDFQPFYEKPPLFLWLQLISYKIFGVSEFAARFPNAIIGIFSLIYIFILLRNKISQKAAWLSVLMMIAGFLPHLYYRSGIIDPLFNLLIFSSMVSFFSPGKKLEIIPLVNASILMSLAILTKGPVALLIASLVIFVYWLLYSRTDFSLILKGLYFGILAIIIASIWFLIDYVINGSTFVEEFIQYQIRLLRTEDAGHGGFPGFHFVIILFGCFPASVFAIIALFKKSKGRLSSESMNFVRMLKVLFWVVILLFSIVQSKIVHYSSLCYFPLCILAASYIDGLKSTEEINRIIRIIFYVILGLISLSLAVLPLIRLFPGFTDSLLKNDLFTQSVYSKESPWKWYDLFPAIIGIGGLLIFLISNRNSSKKFIVLLVMLGLMTSSAIYIFPSRIEHYTQKTLVKELQSLGTEGKTAYPINHKSYAHLFYSSKDPGELLLTNNDKKLEAIRNNDDLILFARVDRALDLKSVSEIEIYKVIPGYIFYRSKTED